MSPAITVLLPTFGDGPFLPAAIDSILNQTFSDFELLVVDDGSTDDTAAFIASLHDPRLRVIRHRSNRGITASLNAGLDAAHGRFIARMDGDDIAEPQRLRCQFDFLERRPEVGVVGSARRIIDEAGVVVGEATAMVDDLSIRWKCLLGNPLPHPTVMLRRESVAELRYDAAFNAAEDYELWTRLLPTTRAANLPQPLLRYRRRGGSISRSRRNEQIATHDRIILLANQRLLPGFPITSEQAVNLRGRYGGPDVRDADMAQADEKWLRLLNDMLDDFAAAYKHSDEIEACVVAQRRWINSFRL
jgi:glycosyltransferase involved in cell wall biosynthesis